MGKEATQFKPGQSGNPLGRPKDTLKVYLRKKLSNMSEREKEEWVKEIPKETQWKMGEGNPENKTDLTSDGKPLFNNEQKEASKKAVGEFLDEDIG